LTHGFAAAKLLASHGTGGTMGDFTRNDGIGRATAMTWRRTCVLAIALVALLASACSSDGGDAETTATTADPAAITDASIQVDVDELTIAAMPAGKGVPQRSATVADARQPLPSDYTESEFLVSGTAAEYTGPATGPATVASEDHPFATRVLVRVPADPADFSGRVWLEPFNTSGGGELDAIWSSLAPLITDRGDAWVGVTVRASQTGRLQTFDAVRYAGVALTNNDHGWDALRSVGTLVKLNPDQSPLAEYDVSHLYMAGYSQSGVDAATFASAFNGMTRLGNGASVYDGYFLGGHGGNLSPLKSGSSIIPKFDSAPLPPIDVPVIDFEAQSDAEGFQVDVPTALAREAGLAGADKATGDTIPYVNPGGASIRQPNTDDDDDHLFLFEVAGAPHSTSTPEGCPGVTTFPTAYFTRAAAALLVAWAEDGTTPPDADRLELAVDDAVSAAATDEIGNAKGGVRSPFVDVPLSRFEVHGPPPRCRSAGNEIALPKDQLVKRYGDVAGHLAQFTTSLDRTIKAKFLLQLDRQRILDAQKARAEELFR
jgi:hypothetical protein